MDTIKIIKGVFNNEDIIKDNNAIAAAFSDGTVIGIDTKNDDKFQKDFLSGSGNKDEKEIYISTIDMLTPEAEVQVNNGRKRLTVKGVRCKNTSHSDSNKSIPDEAVDTLSKLGSYTALTLQMPDSASWNFNGNGTATTDVTFSAKGKSDSVKSTTKHGKFVVTQPIKIKHYIEADGKLPAQSTVYKKGDSSFEETVIQQEQSFQLGKKIRACIEVTQATKDSYSVSSLDTANAVSSASKWLDISCGTHWTLVVSKSELPNTTSAVTSTYETSEEDIKANSLINIGFYEENTTKTSVKVNYPGGGSGTVSKDYAGHSFLASNNVTTGVISSSGKPIVNGGEYNVGGEITIYDVVTYTGSYTKKRSISYTPDKDLFYPGIYCQDPGWYAANGDDANKNTSGKIYSEKPTADNGNMFIGEEKFFTKTATEDSVNANDTLCTVDNKGNVTLIKLADFEEKMSYSTDGNPIYSVSFD